MILTDNDIKSRCVSPGDDINFHPLITNFSDDNLGAISYDLSIESVLLDVGNEKTGYELAPGGVYSCKNARNVKYATRYNWKD